MKKITKITISLCALIILLSHICGAAPIIVPTNQPTISLGINYAVSGDTVQVNAGEYVENITMKPGVIIKSQSGPEYTTIIGTGTENAPASVVSANNNEDNTAVLDGFTITNGYGDSTKGGGISIGNEADSNPKIMNCIIKGNISYGILIGSSSTNTSSTLIINNVISDNVSPYGSAGIKIINSSPKIINNTIINNSTDINKLTSRYRPIFSFENELTDDPGALTIIGDSSNPEVTNNLIANNTSLQGAIWGKEGADPVLSTNNTWNNSGGNYHAISNDGSDISIDPKFHLDPLTGKNDYHLMAVSGCKEAGTAVTETFDIDGDTRIDGVIDIGADEFVDSDANGMPDYWETKYGVSDPAGNDDTDGLNNLQEYENFCVPTSSDTDGDNLEDDFEVNKTSTNPLNVDTDNDGVSDDKEDIDDDGLTNYDEQENGTDPKKEDTDGDGLPDKWEVEYSTATIPYVIDYDTDTYDYDGDGLNNKEEYNSGTSPKLNDTDGDGMPDKWEVDYSVKPSTADANADYDDDGLTNLQEYINDTDPNNNDTDGDGLPDKWEVEYSTATIPYVVDYDTDTYDYDGDGLNNKKEYTYGSSPKNIDSDGDGLDDGYEVNISTTDPSKSDPDGDNMNDYYEVMDSSTDPHIKESISISCVPNPVYCNKSSTITVKIVNYTTGSLPVNLSIVNLTSSSYNLGTLSGPTGSEPFTSTLTGNSVGKIKVVAEVIIDNIPVFQAEDTLLVYGFYDTSEEEPVSFKCIYDTYTKITIPAGIFDENLKVILNPQYIIKKGNLVPEKNPEFGLNISTAIIKGQGYEIKVSHVDDDDELEHPFSITIHFHTNVNAEIYHDNKPTQKTKYDISMYYFDGLKLLEIPTEVDFDYRTITGTASRSGYYVVQYISSNTDAKFDDHNSAVTGVRAIPNIFTPAGSPGENDKVYFEIESTDKTIISTAITIYDLAGRKIKELNVVDGVTPSWDGKNESGNITEGGAYIYVVEIKHENGGSTANGIIVLAK